MIETELRRAFRSRGMLVVVLVAVILAAGNLYSSLQMDRHFAEIRKMMLEQHDVTYYPYIAFEKYIGDNMFLPYNGIYYILFPILAVLPFGTSLVRDEQLHYTRNILVRQSKRRYFLAKYIAAYVSGAVAVLLPLALSFALCATKYPCAELYQRAQRSFIMDRNMFSQFYYTAPWIYMLIYWFVNMLAGGMLAGTALLLSQFIHKRMSVVFIPFIVYSYMAYLFGGQAQYERFSLKSVINMSEGAITVTAEYTAVMFASVTLITFLVYYVVGITKERIH